MTGEAADTGTGAADTGTDAADTGTQAADTGTDPADTGTQAADTGTDPAGTGTDAAGRFVERFAAVLVEAGIPRMPARVFAALFATDSGSLTAGELAARLRASPAAVSGGVRYLTGVGMISREGMPGSRRQHYRVPYGVWDEVISGRDRVLARWITVLKEGLDVVGRDTPAGERLSDSVQYFEFVSAELPQVLARWRKHKAALDAAGGGS